MRATRERGSRGGELGRVEARSAPGRGDRTGPALGDPAQAVPGATGRSVPGHGGLRSGLPPRRDRGGPDRLRGLRGPRGAGGAARRRRDLPLVAPMVRLHPIALACAAGKAGLLRRCRWPTTWSSWKTLVELVESSGIVFMPEFARRCYPATLRLKELLATHLGQPRLVVGHSRLYGFDRYAVPGPTTQIAPAPLLIDPGSYLLDWCWFVFQALPEAVQGFRCQVISVRRSGRPGVGFRELRRDLLPRRDGPDLVRPLSPGVLGRRQPLPAAAGIPGLRRARGGLARDARADPVVGRDRHQGGATPPGADGRRRAQRPVPPPGPGGPLAGADHSRRPDNRPARARSCDAVSSKGE